MNNKSFNLLEQFDEGFITPQRKQAYKKPSPPRFFSSKMKAIADNIHKNTFSKFRIHSFEEGKLKLFAYSELKQVSETSKSRSLTKIHSIPRIQQISRKTKVRLFGKQKTSQQMRQICLQKINQLYQSERMKKNRRQQLNQLRIKNQEMAQKVSSLQLKQSFLEKIKSTTNMFNINSLRLKELYEQFHKKADQSKRRLFILQKHKEEIESLQNHFCSIQQNVKNIQKQYKILCEETIQSLFYTGMLMEQLFIASCGRVDKRSGTLGKIQSRLNDRLHRREVILDYAEELTQASIFLTIYMHSKSVSLNNIAVLMDSLSFYSDHFRELYCYQAFRKYANAFIEICLAKVSSQNLINLAQSSPDGLKQMEEHQRTKIVIYAPQALEKTMRNVLEVFRISSNQFYSISEGCKTKLYFHATGRSEEGNSSEWQLYFSDVKLQQQ